MKSFRLHDFKKRTQRHFDAIPIAISIFLSFVYLFLAGNIIYFVDGVIFPFVMGTVMFAIYRAIIKGLNYYLLRDKNSRKKIMGHISVGLNRVVGVFVLWAVLSKYIPALRWLESNKVMSDTEIIQFEIFYTMFWIGAVYLIWYVAFGKNEKIRNRPSRKTPKIDN